MCFDIILEKYAFIILNKVFYPTGIEKKIFMLKCDLKFLIWLTLVEDFYFDSHGIWNKNGLSGYWYWN